MKTRRLWEPQVTPHSRVGLQPTLFPRSEYSHGPGSPEPGSQRKHQEASHPQGRWRGNELPVTRGKQDLTPGIRLHPPHPVLGLHLLPKMPRSRQSDLEGPAPLPHATSPGRQARLTPGATCSAPTPAWAGEGGPGALVARWPKPAESGHGPPARHSLIGGGTGPCFPVKPERRGWGRFQRVAVAVHSPLGGQMEGLGLCPHAS